MKKVFRTFLIYLLILITIVLSIMLIFKKHNIILKNCSITHEPKQGGVYIKINPESFNKLGFEYGDSINIKFSNGYEMFDVPYYNGNYADVNDPFVVYPYYDYIKVFVKYGEDLWLTAKLSDNDTATISLNEKEKYLRIQKAKDIHYTNIQGNIPDEVFANFRNIRVGKIKENILYRSASPIDNSYKRASVADKLIKEANINYIIDLSDSENNLVRHINKEDFNSPYFLNLYNNDKVLPLSMSMQYKGEKFKDSLVKGLTSISNNSGPYLIHCVEGKDRTGYVLIVIESLLGATYQEMVDDYMETYKNYYSITKDSDIERYETIKEKNIDSMLHYIIDDEDNKKDLSKITDYSNYTKNYLLSIGMEEKSIDKLIEVLSK